MKLVLEGNREIGLGREDPREKAARQKKSHLFGGLVSAVGCGEVGVLRRTGDRNGFRILVADVSP